MPLFFQEAFLKMQGSHRILESDGISIALFGENHACSPAKAPFGGFFLKENGNPARLYRLLKKIDRLAEDGFFFQLEIQLAPSCYSPDISWIIPGLLEAGYQRKWTDLNYHLPVDRPFRTHLHRSERWKLNKSARLGFYFEPVCHPDWSIIHSFILASRLRKGYSLSMSENELRECSRLFPGRYRVWRVATAAGETAALGVTVDVDAAVEYLFYTADDFQFRNLSPVVMLHSGIYRMAEESGKKILDLGTASVSGEINRGVADFKRFLGGIQGEKIRMQKTWKNSVEHTPGK